MAFRSVLTPDDLKRGDLAEVGWHPMEVIDYTDKEADTDGSNNSVFQFKIIDGNSKGVICQKLFNEKALGFGKALWTTFGFPKDEKGNLELSSDLFRKTIGFKLMGYIKRGKSNKGNEFNDVVDFKPMS